MIDEIVPNSQDELWEQGPGVSMEMMEEYDAAIAASGWLIARDDPSYVIMKPFGHFGMIWEAYVLSLGNKKRNDA